MRINNLDEKWQFAGKIIGLKILMCRKLLKLNQTDFALKLGVSFMKVHRWETGKYPPNAIELLKIAELSGQDVAIFFKA